MTAYAVEGHQKYTTTRALDSGLRPDHELPTAGPHIGPAIPSSRAVRVLRSLRAMHGPLALYVTQHATSEPAAAMAFSRDEFLPRDDDFLLGLLRDDVLLDGDLDAAPSDCIVAQLTPIWVSAAVHDQWRRGGLVLDVEPCLHLSTRLEARQGVHFIVKVGRPTLYRPRNPVRARAS